MKHIRITKCIIFALVIGVLLSACSFAKKPQIPLEPAENTQAVLDKFENTMSYNDVLYDYSNIDLFHEMDTKGLRKEAIDEPETSTAKINYYSKDDKLVYTDYEGYGEDSFRYYTKARSGADVEVLYVDQDGERFSVQIIGEANSVYYDKIDKSNKLGAKNIIVSITDKVENDFDNQISYCIENGKAYIEYASFYDYAGYHRYTAYSENGDIYDDDYLMFEKKAEMKPLDKLKEMYDDKRASGMELTCGSHKLQYTENENGKKWYIIGTINVVFDSERNAKGFADDYGYAAEEFQNDERYWVVTLEKATMPIGEEFDLIELGSKEYDDPSSERITLNNNGELTSLDRSKSVLVLY